MLRRTKSCGPRMKLLCVCVCVCVSECACVRMYGYVSSCSCVFYVYTHIHTYGHTYIYTYIHTYIQTRNPREPKTVGLVIFGCLCVCMCVCWCLCLCACACVCKYISSCSCLLCGAQENQNLWASYDVAVDFERGGEIELANVVGSFLRAGWVKHTLMHSHTHGQDRARKCNWLPSVHQWDEAYMNVQKMCVFIYSNIYIHTHHALSLSHTHT